MVKKSQIFVKRPHYIYLEGHIFHCFSTTSSIKEFVVTVQIFVYDCVLGKKKNKRFVVSDFGFITFSVYVTFNLYF